MFKKEEIKVFRVVLKEVLKRLATIKNCPIEDFENIVQDKFDGYNYEGEEDLVGFENWGDISQNGAYQLNIKVNHDDAYEFTLHIKVIDYKVTVVNIL